jgi:predicted CXXCH cytochrome family protein
MASVAINRLASAAGVALIAASVAAGREPPDRVSSDPLEAGFVGAARCADCHPDMHQKWKGGRHSRMLQPATPASVKGDFSQGAVTLRGKRYVLRADAGAYAIVESYLTGRERERRVDYTLGSRRIQHYLTTLEDGRIVVLPPTWDVTRREWFHNMDIVDPEESDATRVQVWNANCHGCHVSQQEKNYDPAARTYATRWVDFGTGCERCHGPGQRHVERYANPDTKDSGGPTEIARPTALGADKGTMVCAQCHSLRDVAVAGFTAGADYYDHFMPILEYGQKQDKDPAYWADGRPRRFSNDALGLWQSHCFLKGQAACTTCHEDPHEPDIERNPQLAAGNNALCTGCHEDLGRRLAEHTRHRPDGAGSSCVGCHMPPTVYSIKARIADHTIGVPVPENTARFGIPNACNACHEDRSADWAVRAMGAWGAGARRRLARRAETFTLARSGDATAVSRLVALAADATESPLIRANAVGHLRRFEGPVVRDALKAAMRDAHPLVRGVAALKLGESRPDRDAALPLLREGLRDSGRIVRMNAAFSLVNLGVPRLDGEDGRRFEAAKADYVARAGVLPDDAATQATLGQFLLLSAEYPRAAQAFEDALRLEPGRSVHYFMALARLGEGRPEDARRALAKVRPADPYHPAARKLLDTLRAPGP